MKAHCLEMLHAKFEVSRSHHLGIGVDYPKMGTPSSSSSCDSVTYIAGLGPAKKLKMKFQNFDLSAKKNHIMRCLNFSVFRMNYLVHSGALLFLKKHFYRIYILVDHNG